MKTRTKIILGVGAAIALVFVVKKAMQQPTLVSVPSKIRIGAAPINTIVGN